MAIVAPTADREAFRRRIFSAVADMYTEVANAPQKTFHFPTGRWACEYVGYPGRELVAIPESAVESFAGVGYPFLADAIRSGDRVLDIGTGSGTDLFVAAHRTGPEGRVQGLDITDSMIEKAESIIASSEFTHVQVCKGHAESLPFSRGAFDAVTSNGVINLVPDKKTAFGEMARVMRKGGRLQIADIALRREISEKSRMDPKLWAECIVGAVPEDHYLQMLRDAGFGGIQLLERWDYFAESPSESTRNAAQQYGAIAITVKARKL